MKEKKPLTHPSFDELLALTVDDLGDQRAHEVREHLLDCPACLAQTRELLQLPDEAPSPEMELSDAELAMDWQRLSATLNKEESTSKREPATRPPLKILPGGQQPASPPTATPPAARPARGTPMWLVAALVAGTAIGLAFGRWSSNPASSQVVAVNNLSSTHFYQRGEPEKPQEAHCPPPGGSFVWNITPDLDGKNLPTSLWVEFRSASGRIIALHELGVTIRGEVQLSVPRSLLPNGQYLAAVKLKEREPPIEEIPVTVECQ